jgi:hypothetical protein
MIAVVALLQINVRGAGSDGCIFVRPFILPNDAQANSLAATYGFGQRQLFAPITAAAVGVRAAGG